MTKITILSDPEQYRLHCKLTTKTETFCGRMAISLVFINTIERQLPAGYFCPECHNEAIRALKESYPDNDTDKPDQAWFWSERWQRMERAAQDDIEAGRIKKGPPAEE